ncbi:LacI family DNA-binding transcriptional regulator [Nocardioides sambongensis]|uniref:LacI family DNA-binding transcriptional regulator n=1 Tax=Nocardioides sambongensis TaxID=2589074 RepID=UPI001E3B7976|nr:LacI family DNA-binding transcriptional regulator [Nocardioides sambongensis]
MATAPQAPTLADVARRAGVSRQTVSNAVNNPSLLREDTLSRVQAAIDELGYVPNRAARNLRTGTTRLVGLRYTATPEGTANTAMDRFVRALVAAARDAGYHLMLVADGDDGSATPDPIKGYDDLLRSTAVDAFVVTETFLDRPQTAWLTQRRAPFVAFGRPWGSPRPGTPGSTSTARPGCERPPST